MPTTPPNAERAQAYGQPPAKLTQNFTLAELTFSQTAVRLGLDNTPGPTELANLYSLALVMEVVRKALGGVQVLPSSAFRSLQVNRAVGSSDTSAHVLGLACDFTAPQFGSALAICHHLLALLPPECLFDQLIFEGDWVHLGLALPGMPARRQVLTAHFSKGRKTRYTTGLPKP